MNNYPLISIIVPVYNTKKYLGKCIESIISQTYKNLEIILVDDGSTDDSGNMCDEFAKKDTRIKVLHKENGGQATARNLALDVAQGDYIGFVDSDDYIMPDMYKMLYESLIKNDADISMCARYDIYEDGKEKITFSVEHEIVMSSTEALRRLLIYDMVDSAPWDKLYKRELFIGIRFPSGYICEDIDVVYKLLDSAQNIVHCGVPLYNYLKRSGSTSRSDFSEKSKGLEIYPRNVYNFIIQKYPTLKCEALYFYVFSLLLLYEMLVNNPVDIKYMKYIQKEIRKKLVLIIANRQLKPKEKFRSILITFNIYLPIKNFIRSIKCVIKGKLQL